MAKKMGAPIRWPEPKSDLAKRLQQVLPKWSCEKIGEKVGRSHDTIRRYLSGKRDVPIADLEKLAHVAGGCSSCLVAWIVTGSGNPIYKDPETNNGEGPTDECLLCKNSSIKEPCNNDTNFTDYQREALAHLATSYKLLAVLQTDLLKNPGLARKICSTLRRLEEPLQALQDVS